MKTFDNPFTPGFDKNVQDSMSRWHIPGVSMAIVQGEHTWTKGYGEACQNTPVEPRTLFYSASTTKAMLGACWAIYIASEENQRKPAHERISFATPLVRIIGDDFALSDDFATREITIEDALSHRTGLPRHENCYGGDSATTPRELTRILRHLPLHNTLRTRFEYCNLMFIVAAHAFDVVTGAPLSKFLEERLWKPLGMNRTYAGHKPAMEDVRTQGGVLAEGHTWSKIATAPDEAEGELLNEGHMWELDGIAAGAGDVISNSEDYACWMRGLITASGPLSQSIVDDLFAPRMYVEREDPGHESDDVPFDGGLLLYSLGWFIGSYKGYRVVWHLGGLTGAGSLVMIVPELKFGVSLFGNGSNGGGKLRGLGFALLDEVLEIPEAERFAQSRIESMNIAAYRTAVKNAQNPRATAFPGSPDRPAIAPALPLKAYTGIFAHPGYGPLTFEIGSTAGGSAVLVSQPNRTWKSTWVIEHVNAENWLIVRTAAQEPSKDIFKARSRVGADGIVQGFEIGMEEAMPDTMIWFARQ